MAARFEKLIPELQEWNDGAGIDIDSWLSAIGDYAHAIGYIRLFWPDLFEHDGCVFRVPMDADTYDAWVSSCQGDRKAIESVVNHLHLADLFPNAKCPVSRIQAQHLGQKLKEMWIAKLNQDFPGKSFDVIISIPNDGSISDYKITFHQPE